MKRPVWIAAALLAATSGAAFAHDHGRKDRDWRDDRHHGRPVVVVPRHAPAHYRYAPPPPRYVYAQPRYYAPTPVYVAPPPRYYAPAPAYYAPAPYLSQPSLGIQLYIPLK